MTYSMTEIAEKFMIENQDLVQEIESELKSAGVDESALDELIHTGAENGDFDSEQASELNNEGMASQIAFILEGNGEEEGRRLIAEAADEASLSMTS